MAVAIYARKSTESEDRQVQSLDDQLKELKVLAERSGVHIELTIIESKSAKEPYSRPEFQRLISMIEAGEVTALLTWHINRLTRNMVDGGIIAHLLQQGKLEYILTPQRRYSPQDSALLLAIENGMATSYIQDLSRAVKRGMKGKVERGWLPGPAPLGYQNNRLTQTIERHPRAFEIVRKGWQLVLEQGFTAAEVQREWQKLGLKGARKANSSRTPSKSSVHRILSNPFYAGLIQFRGELHKGSHEPMITREQFERAQRLLRRGTRRRQRKHSHAFSGLFRCPVCGCRIVGEIKRKTYAKTARNVAYTYYHCTGFKGCSKKGVREDSILAALSTTMDRIQITAGLRDWLKNQVRLSISSDQHVSRTALSEVDSQITETKKRMRLLLEMRLNNELDATEYLEVKGEAERALADLIAKRARLESHDDAVQDFVSERLDAAERAGHFTDVTMECRRGILEGLGRNCFLTPEKLSIQLDPVIAKIAAFEPPRVASQTSKRGDPAVAFALWRGLVDDILKTTSAKGDLAAEPYLVLEVNLADQTTCVR